MTARLCRFCCKECSLIPARGHESQDRGPYEVLWHFLPAGTIAVPLLSHKSLSCDHRHSQDGWHDYPGHDRLQCLIPPQDEGLLQLLDFLVENHFIAATIGCSGASPPMLYLRIYLIPWDLPHAHGRLRMRDTSIINLARKYLNILLPKIVQDDRNWEGEPSVPSSRPRQFLEQEPVCTLLINDNVFPLM